MRHVFPSTKTASDSHLVTLQPKDEDPPPDAKCKDKFLIKNTMITREKEDMTVPDIVRRVVYCS